MRITRIKFKKFDCINMYLPWVILFALVFRKIDVIGWYLKYNSGWDVWLGLFKDKPEKERVIRLHTSI